MPSTSRQELLIAVSTGTVASPAGCWASVGTADLTVRNCLDTERTVTVTIVELADESTILDETDTVEGDTCSDVREPPVGVSDLISELVSTESEGMEPVSKPRQFDPAVVENSDDSISVYIEESGLSV